MKQFTLPGPADQVDGKVGGAYRTIAEKNRPSPH